MKRVIQSLDTTYMTAERAALILPIAALSAVFLQEYGYHNVIYTDAAGARLLSGVPYAEVKAVLDTRPSTVAGQQLVAEAKMFALRREGTGVAHVDYDVMLMSTDLLDAFYNHECDAIVNCLDMNAKETISAMQWMNGIYVPDRLRNSEALPTYNTGVLGFNDVSLMSDVLDTYYDIYEHYQDMHNPYWTDLVAEQYAMYRISTERNANVMRVISTTFHPTKFEWFNAEERRKGFKHLWGSDKEKRHIQSWVWNKLQSLRPELAEVIKQRIYKINKQINEYNNGNNK